MKNLGLAPVTIVTLTLTGLLLPYSGWFTSRISARSPGRVEARVSTSDHEISTAAAIRYRSAQPTHWRALVLQR